MDSSTTFIEPKSSIIQMNKKQQQTELSDHSNIESRYISNAGIILFWPFLKQFFTELNLLRNNEFQNLQGQQRAVQLLQFAGTEKRKFSEHQLILNKILSLKILETEP
ncbi:hypothetical protein BMR06_17025 [Methylococcaceae bacterium HT5]|nr:hypothetical protein BMR06_17025 [Methylococcaceae bacterium HT5]